MPLKKTPFVPKLTSVKLVGPDGTALKVGHKPPQPIALFPFQRVALQVGRKAMILKDGVAFSGISAGYSEAVSVFKGYLVESRIFDRVLEFLLAKSPKNFKF